MRAGATNLLFGIQGTSFGDSTGFTRARRICRRRHLLVWFVLLSPRRRRGVARRRPRPRRHNKSVGFRCLGSQRDSLGLCVGLTEIRGGERREVMWGRQGIRGTHTRCWASGGDRRNSGKTNAHLAPLAQLVTATASARGAASRRQAPGLSRAGLVGQVHTCGEGRLRGGQAVATAVAGGWAA